MNGEELGPCSTDRENLCVVMSPCSKRPERDMFMFISNFDYK